MKPIRIFSLLAGIIFSVGVLGHRTKIAVAAPPAQQQQPPTPRVVDLKAADGTILKASYFAAAQPGSRDPGAEDVKNAVSRYYADMSCSNGTFGSAFESHFWPGATISTVWKSKGSDKRQVVVTSVHDFVAQTPEGACSEPIFEEKMDAAEVKIHNGLAQVWAHYQARFGKPGSLKEWSGIDAFTLLKHEGQWRIVSLVFRAEAEGPTQ